MISERVESQLQHGFSYLQNGWKLVAIAEGSKAPKGDNWNALSELIDDDKKLTARLAYGPINMGLCHQYSGTCALDVDDEALARHILEEFGLDYDAIMDQGMRIRSKANRDKAIFLAPDLPLAKINWPRREPRFKGDVMSILELRAGPNQDVLPPSLHPDGHLYTWAPGKAPWDFEVLPRLPDDMLQFWLAYADQQSGLREEVANLCTWRPEPAVRRVQRARASTGDHNDVIGKFNAANDVGAMLEENGYKRRGRRYLAPSSSTAIPGVVVLKDDNKCYSHHGSDVLADGYAHDSFDLLCILRHNGEFPAALKDAAGQLGIERARPGPVPDVMIDLPAMYAAQERRRATQRAPVSLGNVVPTISIEMPAPAAVVPKPPPAVPEHLLKPPGIVGEVVEWILQNSQRPQPLLAVGAALTMFATVLGQKIASDTGLRTNLYFAAVAGTGRGKDRARVAIRNILAAAGMADNIGGEDFASGQGVLARVAKYPVTLFVPDEFGMLVQTIGGKNAASHERSVMKSLLTLYNSTETTVRGSERADQKLHARVDIPYPCVSMYGVTTPETLYPALNSGDVASGWLNRILVLTAPKARPPFQHAEMGDVPSRFVEWIKAARSMQRGLAGLDPATPIRIPSANMAGTLLLQFQAWLESREDQLDADPARVGLSALWARAWEITVKIAMVIAVGRVTDLEVLRSGEIEIDAFSAQWAIGFVQHFMSEMEREVGSRVGDSELDRLAQDVTRILKKGTANGYSIAELNRLSRPFKALADLKKQQAILELLRAREECILVETTAANGKKRQAYIASVFVPKGDSVDAAGQVVSATLP